MMRVGLALLASGMTMSTARAAGYQFDVQSVKAQGSANANAAEAADPATIFYNPAGLTLLEGTQVMFGGTAVDPHSTFHYDTVTTGSGQPASPTDGGGSFAKKAAIPHGYLSSKINDQLTLGLGVFVPFGAKIGYDDHFAGRYYGESIDFKSLAINPSLGYKINEQNSVGIGVSAQYLNVKLGNSVDTMSVAYGSCLAGGGTAALCSAAAAGYAGQPDIQAHVTGSDWGYGFNLGYLFTPSAQTRIGLAYRSHIAQKLEGRASYRVSDTLPGGTASALNAGINTAMADSRSTTYVTTPETVSLNAYHQLNAQWSIMGDLTWNRQSRMQQVQINMPTAQIPDRKITYKSAWHNSWRASLGASYQLDPQWTLRGGYMYDQTPVSAASYAMTILPDATRQLFSVGASYRIDAHNTLDLAYSYLKLREAAVNRSDDDYDSSNGSPGTLQGSYHTHMNLFGLGYVHQF
ncbi:outer membrane protein transport protein [Pokkaliibacter sp. MBI-7]|uniref:OmpP1/FadL family transporter n=1 Tax=Pokkaliibacter sp. MBI-7 TaxID=3040600 RepID=UPI002449FF52|nr:outer membrane protein transport protein [Pokkaliibacter sp. MBI-7]MDH2431798.1 outer membrane protein transport protein [Pokkaliibacter sp. MBI-7]